MSLRHEIVSCQNLKGLPVFRLFPYSCRYCVYWESAEDFDEKVSRAKALQLKGDWFCNMSKEFGDCGVIAYRNNSLLDNAQYALPKFFPRFDIMHPVHRVTMLYFSHGCMF